MLSTLLAAAAAACAIASPPHTVALVELYTSQGCSSCPPADRWLSVLPRQVPPERAVPLALHVGYWDYIGWKDPFARREFNARQHELAALNGSGTVYTPGVFVSGQEWPNWRDAAAFAREVSRVNLRPAAAAIRLTATADGERIAVQAHAEVDPSASDGAQLYLALKQNGHDTRVTRGENRGETLHNDHVVRRWLGPLPLQTQAQVDLPADGPRDFDLVAIVQRARDARTLQAVSLPLAGCLPR